MALDLVDYEKKAKDAVMAFWGNREKAPQKQIEAGKAGSSNVRDQRPGPQAPGLQDQAWRDGGGWRFAGSLC